MAERQMVQIFEVILETEDEGGYHVFCPLLKGCHSCGNDRDEALKNIKEAIKLWLESAQDLGIEIPEREVVSVRV